MDPRQKAPSPPPQRPTSPGSPRASHAAALRKSVQGSSQHAPVTPSGLRLSHQPGSPTIDLTETMSRPQSSHTDRGQGHPSPRAESLDIDAKGAHPLHSDHASPIQDQTRTEVAGGIEEPAVAEADIHTRLLDDYHRASVCGNRHCNHGTFSPRCSIRSSRGGSISSQNGSGGRYPGHTIDGGDSSQANQLLGDGIADGLLGGLESGRDSKLSTTKWLAMRHGVKNTKRMYVCPTFHIAYT
jgi:hypothetical protein